MGEQNILNETNIQNKNYTEIVLRERVKELECLYAISSEIEETKNLDQALLSR